VVQYIIPIMDVIPILDGARWIDDQKAYKLWGQYNIADNIKA
jgi:hypothetical protein